MTDNSNTKQETRGRLKPLHDVAVVLSFMTRLPVAVNSYQHNALAQAAWAFPVAGLMVGGLGGGILYGFAFMAWSPALGVLCALAAMALFTGALHEDGLADMADGFGGGSTVERRLEIMHDSRIGVFGVLVLIFAVALKSVALYELQMDSSGTPAMLTVLAAAVFSRAVLPVVMFALPHARDDGLSAMAGRPTGLVAMVSVLTGAGYCLFVFHDPGTVLASVISMALALCGVLIVSALAKNRIGGQTGDVIGAVQQVAETGFLIAMAVSTGGGL